MKTKAKPKSKESKILRELREAAKDGTIGSLPKEYLTRENIEVQDMMGMNILHMAACSENLDKVPKDLIFSDLCLVRDSNDMSVLHYAASFNQLDLIPKDALTIESLSSKDEEGNTVYHYLANYGGIEALPKSLVTNEVILIKNDFGRNVLDMAIHCETEDINPVIASPSDILDNINKQTRFILKLLSKESLKSIIDDYKKEKNPTTSGGYTHGIFSCDDEPKIKLCEKELKKKNIIKSIVQSTTNTINI